MVEAVEAIPAWDVLGAVEEVAAITAAVAAVLLQLCLTPLPGPGVARASPARTMGVRRPGKAWLQATSMIRISPTSSMGKADRVGIFSKTERPGRTDSLY